MTVPSITDVAYVPAAPRDLARGLLGFVSATIGGGIRVDGLTLRRTREGRLTLAFPRRRDRHGRDHSLIRPLGREEHAAIEQAVFRALQEREEVLP